MTLLHRDDRRPSARGRLGRRRATSPGSTRDQVTGLMNGAAFRAVARHELGRTGRVGESSLLVCCALPPLEAEAEASRDRRLRSAARGLQEATRGEDVLGRTGPLELCALLPGTGEDDAELVAERLGALQLAVGWAPAGAPGEEVEVLLEGARNEAQRALKLR